MALCCTTPPPSDYDLIYSRQGYPGTRRRVRSLQICSVSAGPGLQVGGGWNHQRDLDLHNKLPSRHSGSGGGFFLIPAGRINAEEAGLYVLREGKPLGVGVCFS